MLFHSTEISNNTPNVLTKLTAVCQLNSLKSCANQQGLAANMSLALFLSKGTEGHHFVQTLALADRQNNTKSWPWQTKMGLQKGLFIRSI